MSTTPQSIARVARPAPRMSVLAAALLAGACAGGQQPPPAAAPSAAPAAEPAPTTPGRLVREGVAIEFTATPLNSAGHAPGVVPELEEARVQLRLTDAATGAPLTGIRPVAWLDRRSGGLDFTAPQKCVEKVEMYLKGKLYPEGSLKAHADADLNSFYLLTLNTGPNLTVIDPIIGFGKTKLRTTVLLQSRGADWAMDGEHRYVYVTMPDSGRVAVVDTDDWKVKRNVDVGAQPRRIARHPQTGQLWVANDAAGAEGGVTVLDDATHEVVARIPTAGGAHAVAFAADGHHAFVANTDAGSVSVIDAHALQKVKDLETGPRPVAMAYSPADGAMYVADEVLGTVVAVDAHSLEIKYGVHLEPGLKTLAFPDPATTGHGAHGAAPAAGADAAEHAEHAEHAGAAAAAVGPERFGFLTNPRTGRIYVLDASRKAELLRADSVGHAPDQITFTASFAYVRSSASSEVAMIPLDQPIVGGLGELDRFHAGQKAPREVGALGLPQAIVSSPDMHDAVFIMNPADRMIYYYHYMEGMPIPSGGVTTYGFEPQGVMVVRKGLRETEQGVYTTTVRLTERGEYDLILLLDEPRVVECVGGMAVRANPKLHQGVALEVEAVGGDRQLRAGSNRVRFRLEDAVTGKLLSDLRDVEVVVSAPGMGQRRATGRAVEEGVYEFLPEVSTAGVYYLSFEIPSLGVGPRSRPPLVYRPAPAAAAEAAGGQDEQ